MLKKIIIVICFSFIYSGYSECSSYNEFTKLLSEKLTKHRKIVIGDFLYKETELMSAYSAMLGREFNASLAKKDNITVVSRKRLKDLKQEEFFQSSNMVDSTNGKLKLKIEKVDTLLRGRYFCNSINVSIFAELVDIASSKILYADKITINLNDINSEIIPEGIENSKQNLVAIDNIIKIKPNFGLTISTSDNERNYESGKILDLIVKSEKNCYIAVFCFQNDGTAVLLYPNMWVKNTFIQANKDIKVPGVSSDFEIVVGPPYGTDIIQVIASTSKSKLYNEIDTYVQKVDPNIGYKIIPRGLAVKKISNAYKTSNTDDKNALWSESHLFISTYR